MDKKLSDFYETFLLDTGETKLALNEIDFHNETLENFDLRDWIFCNVKFNNMEFVETSFCSGYFFTCTFINCTFSNCDLYGANFWNCNFLNTHFVNSKMQKATFREGAFSESEFIQNKLSFTGFYHCTFQNLSFGSINDFDNSIILNCEILKNDQVIKISDRIDFQKFLEIN